MQGNVMSKQLTHCYGPTKPSYRGDLAQVKCGARSKPREPSQDLRTTELRIIYPDISIAY